MLPTKRFSAAELYALRNDLPIQWLIEKALLLPCKTSEGIFRFVCPQCTECMTAVNSKTNLARCFRCARNFNTIEITMVSRSLRFVESVEFLTRHCGTCCIPPDDSQPRNHQMTKPLSIQEILRRIASSVK